MADFDLIPNEYRQLVRKRWLLRMGLSACAALAVLAVAALMVFTGWVEAREDEARQLREQHAFTLSEQQRLRELQAQRKRLRGEVLLLRSLQSGAPVGELVLTIEEAVAGTEVWFLSWQFRRSGIEVEAQSPTRAPSYYVLGNDISDFPEQWHNVTHMTIKGEAANHGALSRFVQNLYLAEIVDDVRVQRSAQKDSGISFDLAVVVKTVGETS